MKEWAVFNNDGQLDRGFYSQQAANFAVKALAAQGEDCWVAVLCEEHPEHEASTCEECYAE